MVLSDDYFNVPDEKIPDIRSVLTIVNGKIVHEDLDGKKKKKSHRKWRHDHKHQ